MIWQTDEACVEARRNIIGVGATMSARIDEYARAVAVASIKDVLHGYAGTATAEEVRARAERMLAELGGADG